MDPATIKAVVDAAERLGISAVALFLLGWAFWRLAKKLTDAHVTQLERTGVAIEKIVGDVSETKATEARILDRTESLDRKADAQSLTLGRIFEAIPGLCKGKIREVGP